MTSTYITVAGEVHRYIHTPYRDVTHKPKCPTCSKRLLYIYHHNSVNIGYICKHCKHVYIEGQYKAFTLK